MGYKYAFVVQWANRIFRARFEEVDLRCSLEEALGLLNQPTNLPGPTQADDTPLSVSLIQQVVYYTFP